MEIELINYMELNDFGRVLRKWRTEAGITLSVLAQESHVSANTIARIERQEIEPKCKTAGAIWKALIKLTN